MMNDGKWKTRIILNYSHSKENCLKDIKIH